MLRLELQYLVTWCEELTHLKRPWCWERLKAGGEGADRRWDGWVASATQWTWVWVSSGSWWWTVKPGTLQSMGWQRVGHDWVTGLNWTDPQDAWGNIQHPNLSVQRHAYATLWEVYLFTASDLYDFVSRSFWPDQGKKRTERWDEEKREAVLTNSNTWNPGLRIKATVLVYSALMAQWWEDHHLPRKIIHSCLSSFAWPPRRWVWIFTKNVKDSLPNQRYIYKIWTYLPRRSKRIFTMGLVQSSVNLAVFTSFIGKIQANDHAWPLEQQTQHKMADVSVREAFPHKKV